MDASAAEISKLNAPSADVFMGMNKRKFSKMGKRKT